MLDAVYTFRFLYLLTQKWEDTAAFKCGVIDKDGNQLIKRQDFTTEEQKSSFTRFHQLVFNIKKLIEKVPFGKTTVAKYATALYLIKENFDVDLESTFLDYLNDKNIDLFEVTNYAKDEYNDKYIQMFGYNFMKENNELHMVEDMCTTSGIEIVDKKLKAPDENFAGNDVFKVKHDAFHKSRFGKRPYARFKTYVGEDEVGKSIRDYAIKNPNKTILLKNEQDGSMIFFRKK